MIKKKNLFQAHEDLSIRASVFLASQLITRGIGLILAPVYTRLLTSQEYGVISVYATYASVFTIIMGLQVHYSLNNVYVTYPEEKLAGYASSVLFLSFSVFGVTYLSGLLFHQRLSDLLSLDVSVLFILFPYAFADFCVAFCEAYFRIKKKAIQYAIISISLTVFTSVLSLLLITRLDRDKYLGKIYGTSIPYVLMGIFILSAFFIRGKVFYNKEYWRFCVPITLPMIIHGVSSIALSQMDRVMLRSIIGDSVTGIYSFCYTLAIPIEIIWHSLNNSWSPQFYGYMKEKDFVSLKKHASGYRITFTMLTMGFVLICPEAVKIIAPKIYWSGINVIPLVALSYYFNYLFSFAVNHELYFRKTNYVSIGAAVAAFMNFFLNALLIPRFQMMGAAAATLACFILLFVLNHLFAKHIVKGFDYLGNFFYLKGLIPVICATAFTYVCIDHWSIRWCVGAVVGIALIVRTIKEKSIF